jgi:hypothetical protein
MIGQWQKLFTPSTPFLMTPSSGESIGLAALWSYLIANQTRLINYGREYREGHRISTARVESTVDQLVDWRMEKKLHMRWQAGEPSSFSLVFSPKPTPPSITRIILYRHSHHPEVVDSTNAFHLTLLS